MTKKIPIEISARHVHLSQTDLGALFGKGYQLKKLRELSQIGEFAAKEKVDIQNSLKPNARKISKVRILGPIRKQTQVELSHTDAIFLKVESMVRESSDIKGTPGIILVGPKGKIKIKEGVIGAWRHIHCSSKESQKLGLKNRMLVSVKTMGTRSVTFHKVRVLVKSNYRLCMHLDTDEGNAAGIIKNGEGYLII
jgi:propanediol utilization protein